MKNFQKWRNPRNDKIQGNEKFARNECLFLQNLKSKSQRPVENEFFMFLGIAKSTTDPITRTDKLTVSVIKCHYNCEKYFTNLRNQLDIFHTHNNSYYHIAKQIHCKTNL